MDNARVILKPGKEKSVKRYHPWIFSGAIGRTDGYPHEGDTVKIYSDTDEFLAVGHYQSGSLAVRIFSFKDINPDYEFWTQKIREALNLRQTLNLTENKDTNVYRLINGEGDGLPGLIVDYYNGLAVMQIHSHGMYRIRRQLADILVELFNNRITAIYDKSTGTLPGNLQPGIRNEYLYGNSYVPEITENGCKFLIDYEHGQKTGFFIDQRENRILVQRFARDKTVLNMFCYSGSFSVYAIMGGARKVHSVDSSSKAIEMTSQNIAMNCSNTAVNKSFVTDAYRYFAGSTERFNMIILDPPAFAKHIHSIDNALKGYKKINSCAFEMIDRGGLVFTFSCSQVVSKENFRKAVFAAAAKTGRKVTLLYQLTQAPDHPVSIYHPEGEYLKGLVLYVD